MNFFLQVFEWSNRCGLRNVSFTFLLHRCVLVIGMQHWRLDQSRSCSMLGAAIVCLAKVLVDFVCSFAQYQIM